MNKIRCISLWQPWASLMACGAKHLETRSWNTQVRGPVYIHASKTKQGIESLRHAPVATIEAMEKALQLPMGQWATELPFGKLIAFGELVESGPGQTALEHCPEQEPFGDFSPGRFAHLYKHLTPITPIACRGAQGFFFFQLP